MNLSLKSFLPPLDLGWNRVRAACASPDCHNKLLMRAVPGNRTGIHVGDRWYCSPDCFAIGSRTTLSTLSTGCVVEMPRNPRLSLGLTLLAKGYLNEEQLRFASMRSEFQGASIEATLIEQGFVSEKILAAARSAQWGYPVLGQDPRGQIIEADLPSSLLRACSAVPIHYSAKAKRLVLGFVNRVEHALLQSIEQITGLRAEPCFITPTDFNEQTEKMKAADGYREVVVDDPGTPVQMGRTLGGCAVELQATEAGFAKCKSSVWVRIAGKRGIVDVVFAIQNAPANSKRYFPSAVPEVTIALG